jgi:L-alanine-DL-glutamate epimerase-like enolase superfamily enzyme
MKIQEISLSVFENQSNTGLFELVEVPAGEGRTRWVRQGHSSPTRELHVLHVRTDDGVEGVCTIGDARYTRMRTEDLEQLRLLAVGEDPTDRARLYSKCKAATRGMFTMYGWHGAFDNCLWDIVGKAEGKSVSELIGKARPACPAYYNYGGGTIEMAADDAVQAVAKGFTAVKDHFRGTGEENVPWFEAVREAVGPDVDMLHDAAGCDYALDEAITLARELERLKLGWFEEPLDDRDLIGLQKLCVAVEIPILAPETLMNDVDLSGAWLEAGATDMIRVNGRIGATAYVELAELARAKGTTVEPNGPGGLFGHVHAHLCSAVENTTYYEYFPHGSRDEAGKEIGLMNPPVPVDGMITPSDLPGWGAEWDWGYFEKRRVAVR